MERAARLLYITQIIIILSFLNACTLFPDKDSSVETHLFKLLPPDSTGIDFRNDLSENDTINYFTYPYIYMGGGVSIGDLNNDGLDDLYFTGNMVENRLYLNQGNLKFKDITAPSGTGGDTRWVTGSTMADVNADGLLDIYVSVSGKFAPNNNLLFINEGPNEKGIPIFTEQALAYGLDDPGMSVNATFFDYDRDGDLDVYVANYPVVSFKTPPSTYRFMMNHVEGKDSDHLFRNNGDNTFTDVTQEAGLLTFGLALSATVGDFNNDQWPDLYVSCDFATPDYFFFNNGDGTFTNKSHETLKHTSLYGMGADAADINNDGLLDFMQVDMTPENNRRAKASMSGTDPSGFWQNVNLGLHFQYMQNCLQINNGISPNGFPSFSDVALLTGTAHTDWSWAPLFADFDNDGWKDLYVTNGTRRDINNKDFFKKFDKIPRDEKLKTGYLKYVDMIPAETIDNYMYKNNGGLSFQKANKEWGISFKGYSNGVAYADLDNDGDLELVINNIDTTAAIFNNLVVEKNDAHYLKIKFSGPEHNPFALGAKVTLYCADQMQYQEHVLTRGFQSSVAPGLHFGLGEASTVDQLFVEWPDGKKQALPPLRSDTTVILKYTDAVSPNEQPFSGDTTSLLFSEITAESGVKFTHKENRFNDFFYQALLPHKISQFGPGLATGDFNGDQLEDFYIGGASEQPGVLHLQLNDGTFQPVSGPWAEDSVMEDMGALVFDANNDGHNDLYVVSGGNAFIQGTKNLQDRLYLNQGNGNFIKSDALPDLRNSGSVVVPGDFDDDGDTDLFVGGRITPQNYPVAPKSTILRNDSGPSGVKFTDVTQIMAPFLNQAGMVTSAAWIDFDGDHIKDLVIAGEWMPITFIKNHGDEFEDITADMGFEQSNGWWFSLVANDFDHDGDTDLVLGNLGRNYRYQASKEAPFEIYVNDYDRNGKTDLVLGYHNEGKRYPVKGMDKSIAQIPTISGRYQSYDAFALATLEDIYSEQALNSSIHYSVYDFSSCYLENKGNGQFER
ncbi:MAG: VCBS repeat-containing protein, partial [Cyclobacteriaceae bacterium]|nr:VCBS repeat-containing protein [Cyclobacteriaceae bacterium]